MDSQLFITNLRYYELVILLDTVKADLILIRRHLISRSTIKQVNIPYSQIKDFLTRLKEIDRNIDTGNLEIIVGLKYPLSAVQKLTIPRHVQVNEIGELISKKTRKAVLNSLGAMDVNISYQKVGENPESFEYEVSIVKSSVLSEINSLLGDFSQNVISIMPAQVIERAEIEPQSRLAQQIKPEFIDTFKIRDCSKVIKINHASRESQNFILYRRGINLFSKVTFACLILILVTIVSALFINKIYTQRTDRLLLQLNTDKMVYAKYSNLKQEEQNLQEKIATYTRYNQVRSINVWLISSVEKVLPESIYLTELNISRKDSIESSFHMQGIVTREIDLYRMMETLKLKPHFNAVTLKRILRKNPDFAQFELELETD